MYKKVQVIMIPTEKETVIFSQIGERNNKQKMYVNFPTEEYKNVVGWSYHYLYFLSDDKIKDEDWAISKPSGKIYKVGNAEYAAQDKDKKIISSNDPSLNLPTPSKDFLMEFCLENENIKEVMVEYELQKKENYYEPKLTVSNNILIKTIKQNYTREEVIKLIKNKLVKEASFITFPKDVGIKGWDELDKWISENV